MPFPKTKEELIQKGNVFIEVARCRGASCGAMIEWWRTPKGARMPLDQETLEPHWATCPDAQSFRRKAMKK